MDQLASQQLSALARVNDLLGEVGIAYWLFGGWAVDFYAGAVTRSHDDLDAAVWLDDLPQIAALLEAEGWHHAPQEDEDGGTGYEQGAVRLELTYLVRGDDGGTYTPMSHGTGKVVRGGARGGRARAERRERQAHRTRTTDERQVLISRRP